MTQQDTATDRLISIIQLIQLGKQTGVLTVKRGEGNALEEGMITFANGQIIQAQTGRYSGSEAKNRLSAWGACRFIFASSDTSEQDTLSPSQSFKGVSSVTEAQRVTGNLPGSRDQHVAGTGGPFPQRSIPSRDPVTPLPIGNLDYLSRPSSPVPYRRVEINVALHVLERKKLTRSHHRLLLLIDGKRSIEELVRLMGRNEKEVLALLGDLEQALIIAFRPVPPAG